jgi:predicted DNA binding CopG/RHH family protein
MKASAPILNKVSVRLPVEMIRRLKHEVADSGLSLQRVILGRLNHSYNRSASALSASWSADDKGETK